MKLEVKDLGPQITKLLGSLKPLLEHALFVIVIGSLGFMIFVVYAITQILQKPPDAAYQAEAAAKSIQTSFDQATIDRIQNLQPSNQSNPNVLFAIPATRNNPFSE